MKNWLWIWKSKRDQHFEWLKNDFNMKFLEKNKMILDKLYIFEDKLEYKEKNVCNLIKLIQDNLENTLVNHEEINKLSIFVLNKIKEDIQKDITFKKCDYKWIAKEINELLFDLNPTLYNEVIINLNKWKYPKFKWFVIDFSTKIRGDINELEKIILNLDRTDNKNTNLKTKEHVKFLLEDVNWFENTDPDNWQYCKKINDESFYYFQFKNLEDENNIEFFSEDINLQEYSEDGKEEEISWYYESFDEIIKHEWKENLNQIIAECIFENDFNENYLDLNLEIS